MSDLERRGGSRLSRPERERRAYQLVLATGAFAVIAVVGVVLAIFGVLGAGIPVIAAVLAAVCLFRLRRTIRG
jgi:hypothetical protein